MSDTIVGPDGSSAAPTSMPHPPRGFGRRLLYWFFLVLASLFVPLAIGEATVRALLDNQYHVWPPGMHYVFHPSPDALPGITGVSHFVVNRDGMRGDPHPKQPSYKVLAIGGSTTECLYLDEKEAWPYLLQQSLQGQDLVWIGNGGKSGLNTKHHMLQVRHLTNQHPGLDAIVLLIGVNDFLQRLAKDEDYRPFPGMDAVPLEEYETLMSEAFFTWPGSDYREPFHKRLAIWRVSREFKYRYLNTTGKHLVQDEDGSIFSKWRAHRRSASRLRNTLPDLSLALDEYAGNIKTIARMAAKEGVRLVLATQPYFWRTDLLPSEQDLLWLGGVGKYQEEPGHEYYTAGALAEGMNLYNQRLLAVCHDEQVECVDLEKAIPKQRAMFYDDVHFTEKGSQLVAESFGRYLRSIPPFLAERLPDAM